MIGKITDKLLEDAADGDVTAGTEVAAAVDVVVAVAEVDIAVVTDVAGAIVGAGTAIYFAIGKVVQEGSKLVEFQP